VTLPRPASWETYLATLCVQRPEIATRLTGEFALDLASVRHPLARRMMEIALATTAGESFPLHSVAAQDRDFAAGLMMEPVPVLLPESRVGDLDTAIADCIRRVVEAQQVTEISEVSRQMAAARERGDDVEVGRLAARRRQLATASPRLRRSARAE
jgi:hypothetical protein